MDRTRETEPSGGLGTAVIPREADPLEGLVEIAPSTCRWPRLAITDLAMRDVDAALAADPLFHHCRDGHRGRVEVRYWYFHPLNFSCWHCSEGGGVHVVEPETVVCRHRMAHRTEHPVLEG
jgi:hypothetical protein